MNNDPVKVYWDSCCWLGLINEEPSKVDSCKYVIEEARKGRFEIWTSSLTRAEVYKVKCSEDKLHLKAEKEKAFEDFLEQDFVVEVAVDKDIGTLARGLMRKYSPPLNKPNDAIHLASAVRHSLDELHTYDRDDLLSLDGSIEKLDRTMLKICKAPERIQHMLELDIKGGEDSQEQNAAE